MKPPPPDELIELAMGMMFRGDAPTRLFGRWEQAITVAPVPTPIGASCFVCKESIVDGDVGELLERRDSGILEPFHLDCMALLFLGHELGICAHTSFAGCIDAEGRPKFREAAKLVAQRVRARKALGVPLSAELAEVAPSRRRKEPPS